MNATGRRFHRSIIYESSGSDLLPNSPPSGKNAIQKHNLLKHRSYSDGARTLASPDFLLLPRACFRSEEEIKEKETEQASPASTSSSSIIYEAEYVPSNLNLQNYAQISKIYEYELSATVVSKVRDLRTKEVSIENERQIVIKKEIFKQKLMQPIQHTFVKRECMIHSCMHHPNVIQLYDYAESETSYALIMEYANKASYLEEKLIDRFQPIKNERKIRHFTNQILLALQYVHSKGIIHCDMKLANVLLHQDQKHQFPQIKLCDFGLSHIMDPVSKSAEMKKRCGSYGYIAPQIFTDSRIITPKIDVWGLGIMVYQMCVAYTPSNVPGYKEGVSPVPFEESDWETRSSEVKSFIQSCLKVDPSNRISVDQALAHDWFALEYHS